jgi:hypothetical protein
VDWGTLWTGVSGSPLVVPVVGALALVAAAAFGTRAAASINAESQIKIAELNIQNAQRVEELRGDYQRKLERDKFTREWKRERVKPFVVKLEEFRVEGQKLLAAALLTDPTRLADSWSDVLKATDKIRADLIALCPASLLAQLNVFLEKWIGWVEEDFGSWQAAIQPGIKLDPGRDVAQLYTRWNNSFNEALQAFGEFARVVDDYVYSEHE